MPNPLSPGQAGDPTLIRTGAHKITVGTKVVGFTVGNLQLSYNVSKRQVVVAEYGSTPVNEEVLGVVLGIRFSMPERSLKVFDIAMNGLYPENYLGATTSRGIGRSGIQDAQTNGLPITLHPIRKAAGDTSSDIVLNKVLLTPTGNVEYSDQNQQVIEVEGTCVVDMTKADGAVLALISEANAGQ